MAAYICCYYNPWRYGLCCILSFIQLLWPKLLFICEEFFTNLKHGYYVIGRKRKLFRVQTVCRSDYASFGTSVHCMAPVGWSHETSIETTHTHTHSHCHTHHRWRAETLTHPNMSEVEYKGARDHLHKIHPLGHRGTNPLNFCHRWPIGAGCSGLLVALKISSLPLPPPHPPSFIPLYTPVTLNCYGGQENEKSVFKTF